MKPLKSKTVWTGILSVLGAVAGAATGTLAVPEAVSIGIQGLSAIFLRLAVSKATGAPLDPPEAGGG